MKNKIFLLFAVAVLIGCQHKEPASAESASAEPFTPMGAITVDGVADWFLSDTTHQKVLIFMTSGCVGCWNSFRQEWNEALACADTAQWRRMCVVVHDCASEEDFKKEQFYLKSMGVDTSIVRYLWQSEELPDSTFYAEVVSHMNVPAAPLAKIEGVPQPFLLDRHNNLDIIKTYYEGDTSVYNYRPKSLTKEELTRMDFSKPVEGYSMVYRR